MAIPSASFSDHDLVGQLDAKVGIFETLKRVVQRAAFSTAAAQRQIPAVGPGTTLSAAHLNSHSTHQALQHAPQAMVASMVSHGPKLRRPVRA